MLGTVWGEANTLRLPLALGCAREQGNAGSKLAPAIPVCTFRAGQDTCAPRGSCRAFRGPEVASKKITRPSLCPWEISRGPDGREVLTTGCGKPPRARRIPRPPPRRRGGSGRKRRGSSPARPAAGRGGEVWLNRGIEDVDGKIDGKMDGRTDGKMAFCCSPGLSNPPSST